MDEDHYQPPHTDLDELAAQVLALWITVNADHALLTELMTHVTIAHTKTLDDARALAANLVSMAHQRVVKEGN